MCDNPGMHTASTVGSHSGWSFLTWKIRGGTRGSSSSKTRNGCTSRVWTLLKSEDLAPPRHPGKRLRGRNA